MYEKCGGQSEVTVGVSLCKQVCLPLCSSSITIDWLARVY